MAAARGADSSPAQPLAQGPGLTSGDGSDLSRRSEMRGWGQGSDGERFAAELKEEI